ncbi:hypothetical protein HDU92_003183 [Lobulomyces angularis]|nr:hypothetical protein HDU92_003183 [Lobulomyces angularis]
MNNNQYSNKSKTTLSAPTSPTMKLRKSQSFNGIIEESFPEIANTFTSDAQLNASFVKSQSHQELQLENLLKIEPNSKIDSQKPINSERLSKIKFNFRGSKENSVKPSQRSSTTSTISKMTKKESFNWNADDPSDDPLQVHIKPHEKKGKDGCCSSCFRKLKMIPHLFRLILYCSFGSILFMTPGVVSLLFFIEDRDVYFTSFSPKQTDLIFDFSLGGYPVFLFSVYWTISWNSFWAFRYCFRILPDVIMKLIDAAMGDTLGHDLNEAISHHLDYSRTLKNYLTWCLTNWISWVSLFLKDIGYEKTVSLILSSIFFASLVWFLEKYVLQLFSVSFHKKIHQERIETLRTELLVLEVLNKAAKKKRKLLSAKKMANSKKKANNFVVQDQKKFWSRSSVSDVAEKERKNDFCSLDSVKTTASHSVPNVSTVINVTQVSDDSFSEHEEDGKSNRSSLMDKKISSSGKAMDLVSLFGAVIGAESIGGASQGILLRNKSDAKKIARKIFESLTQKDSLIKKDFEPYFESDELNNVFKIFDKDDNGNISKQEFKSKILEIFYNHENIEKSMRQSTQAISKLDSILKIFVWIIIFFVTIAIFSINVSAFMATFLSIWAGVLFAISGSVQVLVQNLIFLFIIHPYRVEIEKECYVVKEFGLTATCLRLGNGKEIYAPNFMLAQKLIHNFRRSGPQSEPINLSVSKETSFHKIEMLKDKIVKYLELEESREFNIKFNFKLKDLGTNYFLITGSLEHRNNWQDSSAASNRRSRFMWKLKEIIDEVGIELVTIPT